MEFWRGVLIFNNRLESSSKVGWKRRIKQMKLIKQIRTSNHKMFWLKIIMVIKSIQREIMQWWSNQLILRNKRCQRIHMDNKLPNLLLKLKNQQWSALLYKIIKCIMQKYLILSKLYLKTIQRIAITLRELIKVMLRIKILISVPRVWIPKQLVKMHW